MELASKIGLDPATLPRDINSVVGLLNDMLKPIDLRHARNPAYVRYWASIFFGVDQLYLEAVALILDDREPWRFFMFFGRRLTRTLLVEGAEALAKSPDLQRAEKHLAAAKVHLENISYNLCRRRYGANIAEAVFGHRQSASTELDAFLN